MFSCTFSCICMACLPKASTFPVTLLMAIIDGSSTTILSLCIISVLAVPKSMAISEVKKSKNPIYVYRKRVPSGARFVV